MRLGTGDRLRIVNTHGSQVVDLWAMAADDVLESMSMPHSRNPWFRLAPRPGDAHREAARSGLENLARTLSIEWARFGVRPVAILPGSATEDAEVAELVAYLVSPAGAYYSGCAFTLGAA